MTVFVTGLELRLVFPLEIVRAERQHFAEKHARYSRVTSYAVLTLA